MHYKRTGRMSGRGLAFLGLDEFTSSIHTGKQAPSVLRSVFTFFSIKN